MKEQGYRNKINQASISYPLPREKKESFSKTQ